MNCPKCNGEMNLSSISGVQVDVCPKHGLWLDKGELSRITHRARKSAHQRATSDREKGRYEGIFFGWMSLFLPR